MLICKRKRDILLIRRNIFPLHFVPRLAFVAVLAISAGHGLLFEPTPPVFVSDRFHQSEDVRWKTITSALYSCGKKVGLIRTPDVPLCMAGEYGGGEPINQRHYDTAYRDLSLVHDCDRKLGPLATAPKFKRCLQRQIRQYDVLL